MSSIVLSIVPAFVMPESLQWLHVYETNQIGYELQNLSQALGKSECLKRGTNSSQYEVKAKMEKKNKISMIAFSKPKEHMITFTFH